MLLAFKSHDAMMCIAKLMYNVDPTLTMQNPNRLLTLHNRVEALSMTQILSRKVL